MCRTLLVLFLCIGAKGVKEHLDKDCLKVIEAVKGSVENVVFSLISGTILEKNLRKVDQNRKTFKEIYDFLCKVRLCKNTVDTICHEKQFRSGDQYCFAGSYRSGAAQPFSYWGRNTFIFMNCGRK